VDEAIRILRIPQMFRGGIDADADTFPDYWEKRELWEEKWQRVKTTYVFNDWISSCFVGGPHGWCHPDGKISFADNVGKWPAAEEVYNDWVLLSKEFPFLEAEVTLMDSEAGELNIKPVVSMLIRNGTVELVDPENRNLHDEFDRIKEPERDMESYLKQIFCGVHTENAIPMEQLQKWSNQVFGE